MAREAYFRKVVTKDEACMRYTPSTALTEGEVCKVNISATQCIAGVPVTDIAASSTGMIDITNIYAFPCAAAQTFAEGAIVYWDDEGSAAIPAANANGTDDFCLGTCVKTRATTDSAFVEVRLNYGVSAFARNNSSSSSSSSATS